MGKLQYCSQFSHFCISMEGPLRQYKGAGGALGSYRLTIKYCHSELNPHAGKTYVHISILIISKSLSVIINSLVSVLVLCSSVQSVYIYTFIQLAYISIDIVIYNLDLQGKYSDIIYL